MLTSRMGMFRVATITMGLLGLAAPAARADEPSATEGGPTPGVVVQAMVPASHWLGVHAVPIDDALRSQLGLGECLLVQHVVPESPAAQAGLQQYDIVLRFGDTEIHTLDQLLRAVDENKDREVTLTILRGGKQQTMQVKPAARPMEVVGVIKESIPDKEKWEGIVSDWMDDRGVRWQTDGKLNMHFVGPGFVAVTGPFPQNLSVTMHKEGDKPAQITVQRNDDKWEVTEDSLDKLPDDVRPHVERLLGRGGVLTVSSGGLQSVDGFPPPEVRIVEPLTLPHQLDLQSDSIQSQLEQFKLEQLKTEQLKTEQLKKAIEEWQSLQSHSTEAQSMEQLKKAVEELRQEVQELKSREHPAETH